MNTRELFIVDDNADHRYIVLQVLNKFLPEYKFRLFDGGEQLMACLSELNKAGATGQLPAAIILDLHMPFYDGLQILKMLKNPAGENITTAAIPVIIMTNIENEQQVIDCYAAGASAYVKKPIDFVPLKDLLITICRFWVGSNRIPNLKVG